MSHEQRHITFYGEDILAVLELEPNETYVPVAGLCQVLGLAREAQERRVRGHAVLSEGGRVLEVEAEDGSSEHALCLRVDLIPLWLAGVEAADADPALRPRLELFQRESASALWQSSKPQGFGPQDALLPERHQQTPAEQAYAAALTQAILARHQMLIERQLDTRFAYDGADPFAAGGGVDDPQAELLARAVRRVALAAQERTRRNEYPGMYSGLHRQFSISSYRRMPPSRLHEALEWLDRWRGDLMGEPEPPPDI
ncbi:MAG: hypothetical protein RLZZ387_1948 [Chloroflexota bacterium]|jgi:hypothetical protein